MKCPDCGFEFASDPELGLNVSEFRPTVQEIANLVRNKIQMPEIGKLLACCPECNTLIENYRVSETGAKIYTPPAGLLPEGTDV